jgi:hypothetical protein
MLERIISGGQTGADRAALDAAIACGFPHGGWCPRGRFAEDGTIPGRYQLVETEDSAYPVRTERNVIDSDGTVILTMGELARGSALTSDFARRHRKPWLHLRLDEREHAEAVTLLRDFIREHGIRVLNVAGSRASTEPGLYPRCLAIVSELLEAHGA